MSTIDIREFKEEFVIHFGCDQPRINAYTLATSLVSFADAIKEANSLINPGYEVEVVVEAIGPGSFRAVIKTLYKGLDNLFTKENLKNITLNIIASYIFVHTLSPDIEINVDIGKDLVVIEQGDKKIIIPKETHDAMKEVEKSQKFKQDVSKTFNAVENDKKITSFGITKKLDDEKPDIEIPRERFFLLSKEIEVDENSREIIEVVNLQILRAILERSKRRWEFVWRGMKISAPVIDNKFYDDFFAHKIMIAPGDSLEVKLKIYQSKDPDTGIFTNQKFEVTEVIKHIPRMKQVGADI